MEKHNKDILLMPMNFCRVGHNIGCQECNEWNKRREKVAELRELVWGMDIPHPTIPEYVELHEKMQKILTFIDEELIY